MTREEAINEIKSWAIPSEKGREVLETLIPELTESEDERIRKELIEFLREAYSRGNAPEECAKWLVWLDRQKEPENTSASTMIPSCWEEKQKEQNGEDEFLEDELSAFLQNYDKEYDDDAAVSDVARHFYEIGKKQKEQKPIRSDDEKEYVMVLKSLISDFIRDNYKTTDISFYQKVYDWLDERHVPFSCGHENGQSAEWAELQSEFKNINEAFENGKKEVIDHPDKYGLTKQKPFSKQEYESYPIISEDTTSAKPSELDGKALLYTADKSYQIGFRDGVASVKPEWSEEDGKTINDACCWIAEYAGYLMDKNYGKASMLMGLTDKLKSLRPQSQGIYQQVVKGIRDMCDRYEQNGMFTDERARDFLGNVRVKCKDAIECAHILDEPSWKPSEEQMEALDKAIPVCMGVVGRNEIAPLESLYEQLKKL